MKVTLKDNPLLNRNNPAYAESVEREIIDPETERLTQKYNINKHELILIDAKPLSSFKVGVKLMPEEDARRLLLLKLILKGRRVYFSRFFMNDGCFEFSPPEQITFEVEKADCKKLQKLNKRLNKKQKSFAFNKGRKADFQENINSYLAEINREAVKGLLASAKRDFDFILHFNSEMFHHNLTAKGLSFSKETVVGIYEQEKYTEIIDLSDARERMGFISLYAIAFHGLAPGDLYSVDGIFTLQPNREVDDRKRRAGQEVFELVFNEDREAVQNCMPKMIETLKNLPLPEIALNITGAVKKNFTLYCGIGDMGRAFSRLILGGDKNIDDAIKTARRISFYRLFEKYYDEISNSKTDKSEVRRNIEMFASAAQGKKTAGELNFSIK